MFFIFGYLAPAKNTSLVGNIAHIPIANIPIEEISTTKHFIHALDISNIPTGNILVETLCGIKHS
jgi:hypothetical protein